MKSPPVLAVAAAILAILGQPHGAAAYTRSTIYTIQYGRYASTAEVVDILVLLNGTNQPIGSTGYYLMRGS